MIADTTIITCDLCRSQTVTEQRRADAARLARSLGWKIGRRSGSKPRYDLCPRCRRTHRLLGEA